MDKDGFRELFEAALGARFPDAPPFVVLRFCELWQNYLHWYRNPYWATLPKHYRRDNPLSAHSRSMRPLVEAARAAGYEGAAFREVMGAVVISVLRWVDDVASADASGANPSPEQPRDLDVGNARRIADDLLTR